MARRHFRRRATARREDHGFFALRERKGLSLPRLFKRCPAPVYKAAIVLVPSYTAAYLTGEMVWVVPTIVAAGFFAATLDLRARVDADADADMDPSGKDEAHTADEVDEN